MKARVISKLGESRYTVEPVILETVTRDCADDYVMLVEYDNGVMERYNLRCDQTFTPASQMVGAFHWIGEQPSDGVTPQPLLSWGTGMVGADKYQLFVALDGLATIPVFSFQPRALARTEVEGEPFLLALNYDQDHGHELYLRPLNATGDGQRLARVATFSIDGVLPHNLLYGFTFSPDARKLAFIQPGSILAEVEVDGYGDGGRVLEIELPAIPDNVVAHPPEQPSSIYPDWGTLAWDEV